jgi:precorrin-2/cobalt-factor-2 C20-methyltransferase
VLLPFAHTFEGVEDRRAHRENAARVLDVLRRPASCAFLTLGDPMTYSTFTYLLQAVREAEPTAYVEVVPGITSYSSAAAAALQPLVEGDESIAVVSAAQGTEALERALELSENVVVMKAYRRIAEVCELLEAKGLAERSLFTAECSRPGGVLHQGLERVRELGPRYMSLFLVKQGSRR